MKLYIGNLPYSITETTLRDLFSPFGELKSVNVITDKFTGKPRGFAFVEFVEKEHANTAMKDLDGHEIEGRAMRISEAKERTDRGGAGGGRSGGFKRGGFGGNQGGSSW